MAFIAECPFCRVMLRNVPDARLGDSVDCPRCHNLFTLTAMMHPPKLEPRPPKHVTVKSPAAVGAAPLPASSPTAETSPSHSALPATDLEVPTAPTAPPLKKAQTTIISSSELVLTPRRRQLPVSVVAAIGLAAGGLAILSLLVPVLEGARFVFLAIGFVCAVFAAIFTGPASKLLAFVSLGVNLAALAFLVLEPAVHRQLQILSSKAPETTAGSIAVPLSSQAGPRTLAAADEWWDASKDALQQGDLRMRIVAVTVKPVEFVEKQPKAAKEKWLVLRLRLRNVGVARKIVYRGWSQSSGDGQAPRLTDDRGHTYRLHSFGSGKEVADQVREATLPPSKAIEDVLIFEVPAKGIDYLRLELPAAAIGDSGHFRFQIPARMIAGR